MKYSTEGLISQRFHRDVKKLKAKAERLNITLKRIWETNQDDICILSECDYEIESSPEQCSSDIESYFVSPEDYDTLNC